MPSLLAATAGVGELELVCKQTSKWYVELVRNLVAHGDAREGK